MELTSLFSKIDSYLRKASVATVGGFRPPDDPLSSSFGGRFCLPRTEGWPTTPNGPMIPLLQVRVSELPYVPVGFPPVELLAVFIDRERLPIDTPALNGEGWLIKTFPSLAGLERRDLPDNPLRPFPIRWSLAEAEGPTWDDVWALLTEEELTFLADRHMDDFFDHYQQSSSTKIGGWPAYIQGMGAVDPGRFLVQMATEPKCGWGWGDSGNAYLYLDPMDRWVLHWDCY